jgi:serine/threonine protein kinase
LPLSTGSTLAHYQILGSLGAGGMGEVYRARDTKLGRDVALKILPDSFSADPERLARFAREARALAALNHPNIAQVYGFEDSQPVSALIMELIEGDDLSERIRRGPLPYDEAIAIARQIGEALQAAHDRGIIHRDLKPGNIKLRDDGTVKVLDFGLAKALDQGSGMGDQGSGELANSPTITSPAMTERGMILGTAAYMAPEQARGRVVDKRADIWAFGCVLYEMLTGRRAFGGEDVSDTLASILKSDVEWAGVPPRATRLLKKCLEKDPRKRLHDIGDAWDLLEDAAPAPVAAASPRSLRLAWSLATLFALSTIALVWTRFMTPAPAPPPSARFQVTAPPNHELGTYVSLSPDGRRLAFPATDQQRNVTLWVRDLDSLDARELPGTENATSPFWSPDGRFIAFGDGRTLKKIDVAGGSPQKIADAPTTIGMGAWSRDGVIVVGTRGVGPMYRVPSNGGAATPLTAIEEGERGHSFPMFLPDQKRFLYLRLTAQQETQGVYLGSIDAAPAQQDRQRVLPLAFGPLALVQSATGPRLLFTREFSLMSQRFDPDRLQFLGEAEPIAEPIAVAGSFAYFAAGGDVIAYRTGGAVNLTDEQLTWYSRSGKVLGKVGGSLAITGGPASVALAPDGRRAALMVTSPRFTSDLWVVEFARGLISRLTFTDGGEVAPVWAPDSRRLAYRSRGGGNRSFSLMVKDVDGTGDGESPVGNLVGGVPNGWSSDGRFLLFTRGPDANTLDLFALSIQRRTETGLLQSVFSEGGGRLSPDNRWMVYQSNESGRNEIYVRAFLVADDGTPSLGPKSRVSTDGGVMPRWRGDGREIIYRATNGDFVAVTVKASGQAIDISLPNRLFGNVPGVHAWDVTADAQRLLLSVPVGNDAGRSAEPMTVILNWRSAQ